MQFHILYMSHHGMTDPDYFEGRDLHRPYHDDVDPRGPTTDETRPLNLTTTTDYNSELDSGEGAVVDLIIVVAGLMLNHQR